MLHVFFRNRVNSTKTKNNDLFGTDGVSISEQVIMCGCSVMCGVVLLSGCISVHRGFLMVIEGLWVIYTLATFNETDS